jgi:cyclohexyl-isocyanide hydratase
MTEIRAGLLLFTGMTQLDLTGPFEVLARLPGCRTDVVAKTLAPVRTDKGLVITPTTDFASAPQYNLFAVPGGPGTDDAVLDAETVAFVRRQGVGARWVFGICTGSLLLGAAGLLAAFGATVSDDRLTVDSNVFTSGGVTAGIDIAIRVAAEIAGEAAAQQIPLQIEYDPEPPFRAGTPFTAPKEIVQRALAATTERRRTREAAVRQAADALSERD